MKTSSEKEEPSPDQFSWISFLPRVMYDVCRKRVVDKIVIYLFMINIKCFNFM